MTRCQVYFERVRFERWTRERGSLKQGIDRVSLPIVIKVFPVLTEGEHGSAVIDVTPLFTTEVGRGFALELRRRFHKLYKPTREGEEPLPASMGFVFHTSLLLLPQTPMPGRCVDDCVGFFATPFDEYGTSEHAGGRRASIKL